METCPIAHSAALDATVRKAGEVGVSPGLGERDVADLPSIGRRMARARRGDVRLALLLLLAEEPQNGYQLMKAVEQRSGGLWRPSAGSVYPALTRLQEEGMIRGSDGEHSKRFELTAAGRRHLRQLHGCAAPWERATTPESRAQQRLHWLMSEVELAALHVAEAGNERQIERAKAQLSSARQILDRILTDDA